MLKSFRFNILHSQFDPQNLPDLGQLLSYVPRYTQTKKLKNMNSIQPLRRSAAVCSERQPQRVRLSNRVIAIPKRLWLSRVSVTGLGGTVALQSKQGQKLEVTRRNTRKT